MLNDVRRGAALLGADTLLARASAQYLHDANGVCAVGVSHYSVRQNCKIQEQLQFALGVSPGLEESSFWQVSALPGVTLLPLHRAVRGFLRRFSIRIHRVLLVLTAKSRHQYTNAPGEWNAQPKGFYTDRASDRGRHYRHSCRDSDPEVCQYEGQGLRRGNEV